MTGVTVIQSVRTSTTTVLALLPCAELCVCVCVCVCAGAKGKVMVKCPPDKFKVTPYLYGPCSMVRYLLPCVNVCVYACNTCVV